MRREARIQFGLLTLAGAALLSAAVLAGRLAYEHMQALGEICGGAAAHCGWCFAALALSAGGLASLWAASRPQLSPAAARRRDSATRA